MTDVHICRPESFQWRAVGRCRRCRTRRRLVVTSFVWYGPVTVCATCGAYVNDGALHRRTRRDCHRAVIARALWPALPNRDEYREWIKAAVA